MPRSLKNSERQLKKARKLLPALSQTFSKAPYSYVEGVYPAYAKRGKGCRFYDVDGNSYIDHVLGLGPITLGYSYEPVNRAIKKQVDDGSSFSIPHELEVELAEELCKIIPCAEMVKYAKTGSDAVTGAVRGARGLTGKDKIAYCGSGGVWHDWFAIKVSRNKGIPKFNNELIRIFEYNNIESLKKLFEDEKDQYAAVVMEPMVVDFPKDNFLQNVKKLAHDNNAVLIFDEVVTGFRFANGGAQEVLGVEPDIATFGKGMANGMPLGAIAGKSEYMKIFDDVFYSTTYAGEAVALAAGLATVQEIVDKKVPKHMEKVGKEMQKDFNAAAKETGAPCAFIGLPIRGKIAVYDENGQESLVWKSLFFQEAVKRGVFFGQGAVFQSYSHKVEDIERAVEGCHAAMKVVSTAKTSKNAEKMLEGNVVKPVLKFPV